MRTRYRGKRRRMKFKRGTLVMLLLLTTVFLVSCMAGSDPIWIREVFGLDVAHYNSEPTVAELPSNGEQAEALCDMVTSLCDNSLHLTPFRTAPQQLHALYGQCTNAVFHRCGLFPRGDLHADSRR